MLEIAIGLIFVYLLFSLICSALSELVAWATDLRARTLRGGIEILLADPKLREFLEQKKLLKGAFKKGKGVEQNVASTLYEHPLIQGMMQDGKHPSYIPKDLFASAFLDLLREAAPASTEPQEPLAKLRGRIAALPEDSTVRKSLEAVLDETTLDIHQAKARVEKWFDDAMDRVSGWYKRRSQWVVLIIAAVLVIAANADSVMIARVLSRDSVLRASLVAAAEQTVRQPTPEQRASPDAQAALAQIREIEARLIDLRLPIGWSSSAGGGEGTPARLLEDPRAAPSGVLGWLAKMAGLLFTIFAVSLGAPFWFDVLNKVVNVRITGKQPEPAPAKAPERAGAAGDAAGRG
jgi:hypothetical protein